MVLVQRLAILLGCLLLAGCGALLPRSRSEDVSHFASYEAAREAMERVVVYRDTLADLKRLGFDTEASKNVEQVPFPQWVNRLVHPLTPLNGADAGIRDCLAAELACRAYAFRYGRIDRERRGAFIPDFFNFRRVTRTSGWRFEGLVLVRGETVLFRNHGGQPKIELVEDRRNPLGPFQSLGESAPSPVD